MITVDVLGVGACVEGSEIRLRLVFHDDEPLDVDHVTQVVSDLRYRVEASVAGQRGARLKAERVAQRERSDKDRVLRDPKVIEAKHLFETTDERLTRIAYLTGIAYPRLHGIKQRYGWERRPQLATTET